MQKEAKTVQIRSNSTALVADPKVLPADYPALPLRYVQPQSAEPELHYHDCLELGLCVAGSGVEMIGSRTYFFSSGSLSVIPAGCVHDAHIPMQQRGMASRWQFIFVDLRALSLNMPLDTGFLTDSAPLLSLFQLLFDELERHASGWQDAFRGLLSAFLVLAQRIAPSDIPLVSASLSPEMSRVLRHIALCYAEPITVEQLARLCSMSVSSFTRQFRRTFGVPPLTFVHRMRLTVAAHLLTTTEQSVLDIAQEVGFATLSSFNRLFSRTYGCPPRAFRQRA